ncbi:MAG: AAA family ATPase, partial [Candidatus Absconditabacteria bacterium]
MTKNKLKTNSAVVGDQSNLPIGDILNKQNSKTLINILLGKSKFSGQIIDNLGRSDAPLSYLKALTKEELIQLLLKKSDCVMISNKLEPSIRIDLEEGLSQEVIGQENAKKVLIDAIIDNINSVRPKEGPLGVYFFAGPPGVGKTEIAKSLGKILLGNKGCITKINCESYAQSHTARDLFGSPKSYVGYGSPTPLSDVSLYRHYVDGSKEGMIHPAIKRLTNFSILLLDEIEKAHPEIHRSFLSIFQDGKCRFPTGREEDPKLKYSIETDFSNTIIIMTSNIGSKEVALNNDKKPIGFGGEKGGKKPVEIYNQMMKELFPPEFADRIDKFIVFESLTVDEHVQILHRELRDINRHLKIFSGNINLEIVNDDVLKFVVEKAMKNGESARNSIRMFRELIEKKINLIVNSDDMKPTFEGEYSSTTIKVYLQGGEILFGLFRNKEFPEDVCNIPLKVLFEKGNDHIFRRRMQIYYELLMELDGITNYYGMNIDGDNKHFSKAHKNIIKKVITRKFGKNSEKLIYMGEDFIYAIAEAEEIVRGMIRSNLTR